MKKHNISFLILEKDKKVREHLLAITSKLISNIEVAENNKLALRLYLKKRPDMVLADFEMESDNGDTFIQQIRKHDKKTRIIVMSAKADPELFMQAIQYGVKGFLLKPIDQVQLTHLLVEQLNDIKLERDFEKEELKRLEAESERDKSEQILKTLSQATALFFRYGVSPSNINKILHLIGKATHSNRVNIFRNFEEDGKKFTGIAYSWVSGKEYDQSDKLYLRKIPYLANSFLGWSDAMIKGRPIKGLVGDFSDYARKILVDNGVKSFLSIPIMVDNNWWGFISLDDCEEEKVWSAAELRAMETVAFNLGAAIYRFRVEQEMIRLTESLENRVRERTVELEKEIVDRMLAEELLKDSEEKYRMIYENASDGILLIQNKRIVLTNPSMVEMMERMPRLLIGKEFCDFVVPHQKEDVIKYFTASKGRSGNNMNVEIRIPGKANKWLELKTTTINWDDKPAFLVFSTDITLRIKAEQELNQLNKSLEERIEKEIRHVKEQQELLVQKSKLESLGELSAGLAHEINQPLLGLSMGLDNILLATQSDNFSPAYVKSKLDILFKDIERIKKIIEHVRTFSRVQQHSVLEKIEINSHIRDVLVLTNKMLQCDQVDFKVQLATHEIYVMGNPFKLEQVIINLLSNAKQAVDEKLKFEKNASEKKKISLEINRKNAFVFITVTDNGVGIPKSNISKIFDPFYTTKNEEMGTGLGLSISYGIIKEMDGTIEVESIEHKYTTITIKLPVATK